jgi:uncharacterized Zn-binding protein involved in type VI secretion
MMTPAVPPIPHVGGMIMGPGSPTVIIGNMPAARALADMCLCPPMPPPVPIVMGSPTVMINNMMAARMGDPHAHGGTIVMGFPTVIIGP